MHSCSPLEAVSTKTSALGASRRLLEEKANDVDQTPDTDGNTLQLGDATSSESRHRALFGKTVRKVGKTVHGAIFRRRRRRRRSVNLSEIRAKSTQKKIAAQAAAEKSQKAKAAAAEKSQKAKEKAALDKKLAAEKAREKATKAAEKKKELDDKAKAKKAEKAAKEKAKEAADKKKKKEAADKKAKELAHKKAQEAKKKKEEKQWKLDNEDIVKQRKEKALKGEIDETRGKYATKMTKLNQEHQVLKTSMYKELVAKGKEPKKKTDNVTPQDAKLLPQPPAPFHLPEQVTAAEEEVFVSYASLRRCNWCADFCVLLQFIKLVFNPGGGSSRYTELGKAGDRGYAGMLATIFLEADCAAA